VTVPTLRLYEATDLAERAAVRRQWPGAGEPADHEVTGGLQFVADALRQAAGQLGAKPPPAVGPGLPRAVLWSLLSTGGWAGAVVVGLVVVPDPAVPWRFAAVITGGALVPTLPQLLLRTLWARRAARTATGAPEVPDDLLAGIRTRVAEVVATLDPDQHEAHLAADRSIESALANIDVVESLERRRALRPESTGPTRPD
jgi:hypothetical protein